MDVLLIEDDHDQLAVRRMLLEQQGFRVTSAGDVQAALHANEALPHKLALLDLCLPRESDGLRLIRELKSARPEIAIILLTGADPGRLQRHSEMKLVEKVLVKGSPARDLIAALTAFVSPCKA